MTDEDILALVDKIEGAAMSLGRTDGMYMGKCPSRTDCILDTGMRKIIYESRQKIRAALAARGPIGAVEPIRAKFDDGFLVEWSEPIPDGEYILALSRTPGAGK